DILSSVNIQHDCHAVGCQASGVQHIAQERELTMRTRSVIQHADDINFVINVYSLHNYKTIRDALPLHLKHANRFIPQQKETDIKLAASER
ncbi:hypothetical protein CONPUDRAFT_18304, partial [Coniophora puteana RWD-64-598 SS2]